LTARAQEIRRMPVTRAQLPTVAGFDNRLHLDAAVRRANTRLTRWVFGMGFLAFHLAVFISAFVVAFAWDLISHPESLRVVDPFRYWGIVAIVHTVLAGGGILAWKMLRLGESGRSPVIPAPTYSAIAPQRPRPSAPYAIQAPITVQVPRASRWSTMTSNPRRTPWAVRPVEQNWPQQPSFLRNAPNTQDAGFPDVGEATWPESVPLSTSLGVSAAPESDQVVSVDHRPSPSQSWIEGFIGSRTSEKEHRWSWVEAAAGSWLSRRDNVPPPEPTPEATPPGDTDQPSA
jgi:hypothetical protein